jgi:hypothetical protein
MQIANILSASDVNLFEVKDRGSDPRLVLNSIFSETPHNHKKFLTGEYQTEKYNDEQSCNHQKVKYVYSKLENSPINLAVHA